MRFVNNNKKKMMFQNMGNSNKPKIIHANFVLINKNYNIIKGKNEHKIDYAKLIEDYDLENKNNRRDGNNEKPIIYSDYVLVNNNFNNQKVNKKHGADYENIAFVKNNEKNQKNRMFGNKGNDMNADLVVINKNINIHGTKNKMKQFKKYYPRNIFHQNSRLQG